MKKLYSLIFFSVTFFYCFYGISSECKIVEFCSNKKYEENIQKNYYSKPQFNLASSFSLTQYNEASTSELIKNFLSSIGIKIYNLITFFDNHKKLQLDLVSASMSDTIQNFNSNSIIKIKSNMGNIKFLKLNYMDKNGNYINCNRKIKLIENRRLGSHLRSYLLFVEKINKCISESIYSKISLTLKCAKITKVYSSLCSNRKEEIIELFLPGYQSYKSDERNKKTIHLVIPYIGISNYYSGIVQNNNYTSSKLFIKNNTSLAIKINETSISQSQFHHALFFFIKNLNQWAETNKYTIKYVYDFDLSNSNLDNIANIIFPYHSEYLDILFFRQLQKYNSEENKQKIKIFSLAGANFFRPVSINTDSSIFYTKTPSDTVKNHMNKLTGLCIPIYRNNFCNELNPSEYIADNKDILNFNNKMFFPICGNIDKINEKTLFSNKYIDDNSIGNWSIYSGEYAISDCKSHKSLIKINIKNKPFDLLTIHNTKNLSFFNANTNGLGVNIFSSETALKHFEDFIKN